MLEAGWLQILNRITPENLNNVSLITVTGAELVIQSVFRLEHDFMVLRARTAGTMDTGRTIVVPHAQIDFLAFNAKMSEDEALKLFDGPFQAVAPTMMMATGKLPVSTPTPLPMPIPRIPAMPTTVSEDEPAPAVEEEQATVETPNGNRASKSILLARLRERLADKAK